MPKSPTRRTTAPEPPLLTVPLRECCQQCINKAEAALNADYCEKWSRGAARKRRMSESELSSPSSLTKPPTNVRLGSKLVKVDEVESCRLGRDVPRSLPKLVDHHCFSDEDEENLFPLPSPRRTPNSGTPPATPKTSRTPSPSPSALKAALTQSTTTLRSKPACPSLTGRELLRQCPDVDAISPVLQRRTVSESVVVAPSHKHHQFNLLRASSSALKGIYGW